MLAGIRALADKAKAAASAATKASNAELPVGAKLPTMVVANHAKAAAIGEASKQLIEALQSGSLVVKGAGKVLKTGDVSIRIGAPLASLELVVAQAQAKASAGRDARKVKRYRAANEGTTKGLDDATVLELANAHAAGVEAAKAAKAAPAAAVVPAAAPVKLQLRKAA